MRNSFWMTTIVALFAGLISMTPAKAQSATGELNLGPRDAADGVLGRAGDLSGTPEDRGQRIHDQQVEDSLQRVERNQGEEERLRQEEEYRRTHKY